MNKEDDSLYGVSKIHSRFSGFTIVELLVVIVVIGILAAITLVSYAGISSRATVASMQSDLANASQQLKLFQVENSNYPATINCAAPDSTTNKCLKSSADTTYEYFVDNTAGNQNFCVTVAKNAYIYSIKNMGSAAPAAYCPVLYLDAGNKDSYVGTGTTWIDLSGNSNNGTLLNGVAYSGDGGGAMSFDGLNDYIDLGTKATVDITTNITVEAWVKTAQTTFGGIVTKYDASGGSHGYDLAVYTNKTVLAIRSGANGNGSAYGTALINDNNWHHAVGVYNSSTVTAYSDGVAGSPTSWTYGPSSSTTSLQIGARQGSGNFAGLISSVRVYNRALSSSEILKNFNATKGRYGL